MARLKLDIAEGTVFGRLTAIRDVKKGGKHRRILCLCECGARTAVQMDHLLSGNTKSCGCLRRELALEMDIGNSHRKIHGLHSHPLYSILNGMLQRCNYKDSQAYSHYGARGITLCEEWQAPDGAGLRAFIAWNDSLPEATRWNKGLYIDRIENNKGYSPDNCQWVTRSQNLRNRRVTVTVRSGEHKGRVFSDLFDEIGHRDLNLSNALIRYKRGWAAAAACTVPKLR